MATTRPNTPAPLPRRPAARAGSQFNRPLVSTIDRYVLSAFLKNYFISLFVLIGMYVVLDMVFNFDEFVQVSGSRGDEQASSVWQTFSVIGQYYFFQAFRVFSYLAGVIPVVATAFTLMRMSRFNELTALLASGMHLMRVAAPVVVASFILNFGLLLTNQEVLVPTMIDKLTRERGESASKLENRVLRAMPDGENGILFAGRYTPPDPGVPAKMEVVDVFLRRDGLTLQITADEAIYDAKTNSWTLINGRQSTVPKPGSPRSNPVPIEQFESTVNPESIALFVSRGDFVDLLSSKRIGELLAQKTSVGRIDLMRVRDARWSNYLLNVVLVLLTVPCVLTREPTQLRTAAARVFLLVGACMATVFICQNLAGQPPADPALASKWPALMAIAPVVLFTPIAIWLCDRIKT
jgi:lipopolysaccharide export system permease protein